MARWVTTGRAWALVVAGLLVLFWAAQESNRYRPNPFDADDPLPCSFRTEGCPSPAEIETALRTAWWAVGVGGLLVLAGVALTLWCASAAPHRRAHAPFSALVHAMLAAAGSLVLLVPFSLLLVLALFMGPQAIPAAAATTWLALAGLLAGLDTLAGRGGSPRRSWATALALGAVVLGVIAWAWWVDRTPADPWGSASAVGAGAAGLGTLVARLGTDPLSTGGRPRLRRGAALAAVLLLGGAWAFAVGVGLRQPPVLPAATPREPLPPTPPATARPPATIGPAPTTGARPPATATTTPPPPVPADVPCAPADLRFAVSGVDGAMGARAASIRATNVGAAPCWVEGVPVVTLRQGDRPLHLTVEPGRTPQGEPATAQRVGLAPGGRALALLTWRSYGGLADDETPQSLTVALDAASPPAPVALPEPGRAPFDIADGGEWGVAPWAPPWN